MNLVRQVGYSHDRKLFLSTLTDVRAWSPDFTGLPRPFIVVTAFDSTGVEEEVLSQLARGLINAGCRCSCTWGPDSSRMDVAFDLAAIAAGLDGSSEDEEFVMTVDHGKETLGEALWYALFAAFTADPTPEARAVLAIASPDLAPQIASRFADPEGLSNDVGGGESP